MDINEDIIVNMVVPQVPKARGKANFMSSAYKLMSVVIADWYHIGIISL